MFTFSLLGGGGGGWGRGGERSGSAVECVTALCSLNKTHLSITERLLMEPKESNQSNKQIYILDAFTTYENKNTASRHRGEGGYSHFFFIRRLGPSIYTSPKKNHEFQAHTKYLKC